MITIASDAASASILAHGGILWEPQFLLADGRWVTPLAKAPWADEASAGPDELAYIQKLGGAFLGLPFGGRAIEVPVGDWAIAAGEVPLHGLCATATWHVVDDRRDRATIALTLPLESAIARVEQTYTCAADAPRIDVTVTIHARRAESVAVGYHPILRLPEERGALELRASFASGYTGPLPNGAACTMHHAPFAGLNQVPAKAGGTIDLAHLPTDGPAEELVLLGRVDGPVVARYHDAGYDLVLDWDRAVLPNCLIWYHDRAADASPWDGRFRGIGVEPCASAFDFSAATSRGPNPLAQAGERTSVPLRPGAPLSFTCSIGVEAIA